MFSPLFWAWMLTVKRSVYLCLYGTERIVCCRSYAKEWCGKQPATRRECRRARRNRKTRYRSHDFKTECIAKQKGLSLSVEVKIQEYITAICRIADGGNAPDNLVTLCEHAIRSSIRGWLLIWNSITCTVWTTKYVRARSCALAIGFYILFS